MKSLIIIFLLLIVSVFPEAVNSRDNPVVEKQTIVFTTIYPQSWSPFLEMSDIYKEAFGRLGYGFKLISQPGERSMIDANQGVVDGEAARIMNLDRGRYPNLIRVPHSILTIQEGAYGIDGAITIDGWESLASRPYRVGLTKGVKSYEQFLPLYVDKEYIISFTSIKQGLDMLKARRIDLFIVGTLVEDAPFWKTGAYDEVKRVGIVETKTLFPWLHKRHKDLVKPLADMLRTLKLEGHY